MMRALRPPAAVAMLAAIAAGCSSGDDTSTASSSGEGRNATARQKAVKFSECMRDNGVEEFPDPDASGDFTIEQIANGSAADTNTGGDAEVPRLRGGGGSHRGDRSGSTAAKPAPDDDAITNVRRSHE